MAAVGAYQRISSSVEEMTDEEVDNGGKVHYSIMTEKFW